MNVLMSLVALAAVACSPAPTNFDLLANGKATYYNPRVMDRVVTYRGMWDDCPECRGFVAVNDCSLLGRKVWLWIGDPRFHKGGLWGPYLIADCRRRSEVAPAGWAIDLSYDLAVQFGAWQRRDVLRRVSVYLEAEHSYAEGYRERIPGS